MNCICYLCKSAIIIQSNWKKYYVKNNIKKFILQDYFNIVEYHIKNLAEKFLNNSNFKYEPTIFEINNDNYIEMLKISYKVKKIQMMEGKIAEIIFENFYGWKKCSKNFDLQSKDKKYIIELKNKYNTCNHSSKNYILDNLANYKKNNPDVKCVYGVINPKKSTKKLTTKIIRNNREIFIIQGKDLLTLIFNWKNIDFTYEILSYIKTLLENLI